jgi:hypothetical protein
MSFLNRESCEMVIPGNRFSEELTGRVQFEASYFPIEEHHINRLVTSG